VENNSTNTND